MEQDVKAQAATFDVKVMLQEGQVTGAGNG